MIDITLELGQWTGVKEACQLLADSAPACAMFRGVKLEANAGDKVEVVTKRYWEEVNKLPKLLR
jgi:hypothetical protein